MEPMDYIEEEEKDNARPSDPYSEAAKEDESDTGGMFGTRSRSRSHQEDGLES